MGARQDAWTRTVLSMALCWIPQGCAARPPAAAQFLPEDQRSRVICVIRLNPRADELLANGTRRLTSTIEILNNTQRDLELTLEAFDLRRWPASTTLSRLRVGTEPVTGVLELLCPAGAHALDPSSPVVTVSVRADPLRADAAGSPGSIDCSSRGEGLELAERIHRDARECWLYPDEQLPRGWKQDLGTWSLNGIGTDNTAAARTIHEGIHGDWPIDTTLVHDLPVCAWPRPVIALCVEARPLPHR